MASRFPDYEPIGVWWTVDAPSLRVPDPAHRYVSIWSAGGDGPSILLVPSQGADHTAWEHLVPELASHFTVHAMDARVTDRDVVGVRTAADAVGARIVVADSDSVEDAAADVHTIRFRADTSGAEQLVAALRDVSTRLQRSADQQQVDDQEGHSR